MPFIPGFIPSVNGLHFTNDFPSEPDITMATLVGPIGIGDASNGLCGGMVFTVLDIYTALLPPIPDLTQPSPGSPLYKYIVNRLIDSFGGEAGIAKYMTWMERPSNDTLFWGAGTVSLTLGEWPGIKTSLDGGMAVPVALVIPQSPNPFDLGHNHQVLAHGYTNNSNGTVTVHVYDPNKTPANADNMTITFNPNDHRVALTDTLNMSDDNGKRTPVRGFFRVVYAFNDPHALEPTVPPASNAFFVGWALNGPYATGTPTQATVFMKNIGTSAWNRAGANPFRLGSQNPQDNMIWGTNRATLPNDVNPGEVVGIAVNVISPSLQGSYNFQWRMVQEAVMWFGQSTPNAKISVTSTSHVMLKVRLQPSPQPVARAFQLTVFASDPNTGGAVNGADVLLDGKKVGVTGAPFSTTISEKVQAAIMGGGGGGTGRKVPTPPAGIVRAQNYADTEIVWNVPGGEVL